MSAPARLLGVRLQGFKSFAGRTIVEFGPGISAVVGPNGSGKSNLADALRWALGEQGRALRSRRSEDVIFAGSDGRAALGMADVTIVLDNGDGLLPVEYRVVELGRRLYRSGENEYLLNRTRVRLKDLVDLLDAAHLADNAFLFIGQGMVDQALALRPEERRPLLEEVAGVRRHERRKRAAEGRLVEAEVNLARVRDILAELRPQARRLAAQAEQQAARADAGSELARALVASARFRWNEAGGRSAAAAAALRQARTEADGALAALRAAEEGALALSRDLEGRAGRERDLRADLEAVRADLMTARLTDARLRAEEAARIREGERLAANRTAAEGRLAAVRRALAAPAPETGGAAIGDLEALDRALVETSAEIARLRATGRGEAPLAAQRRRAALETDRGRAERASTEAEIRLEEERALCVRARAEGAAAGAELARVRETTAAARRAGEDVEATLEAARAAIGLADGREAARAGAVAAARAAAAELEVRLAALDARLAEEEEGAVGLARRRGGRALLDGVEVERDLQRPIEAVLGSAVRAAVIRGADLPAIGGARGTLVLADAPPRPAPATEARELLEGAVAAGGGRLAEAVRRDPDGTLRRLLERAVWVPTLADAMRLLPALATGWSIATTRGDLLRFSGILELAAPASLLERRAERDRLAVAMGGADEAVEAAAAALAMAREDAASAKAALARANQAAQAGEAERRRTEEVERAAARRDELAARELVWHEAQVARLEAEAARAASTVEGFDREIASLPGAVAEGAERPAVAAQLASLLDRERDLRARRAAAAERARTADAARRRFEGERQRLEATLTLDEARLLEIAADEARLTAAEVEAASEGNAVAATLGELGEREAAVAAVVDRLVGEGLEGRGRLLEAETAARGARERVRAAEIRTRTTEVEELEARLALDAIREHLLVELAALGGDGLAALLAEATGSGEVEPSVLAIPDADDPAAYEAALDAAVPRWVTEAPSGEPPAPGRLAALRRRYHDLGAANPFAAQEHAEVRARLDALEEQREDLERAIGSTRALIAELDQLITDRFLTTFRALEDAFARRFTQLFGGGSARLALTDPADLAGTGVEIVARPPGKKAQALAMLSGGERALTAVALLFAMLEVRPVPFCVLDEVDAALDETNIGRFAESLRELAERTQFIVITHNRGTIERADALYGITIGDDAISRVVSLRLDEAAALVTERRDGGSTGEPVAFDVGG